jgi:hypothetical protein
MGMTIYVFGNEHLLEDKMARDVAAHMQGHTMKQCRFADDLLTAEGNFVILDVVKGINEPRLVSVEQLNSKHVVSAHDFDVGHILKLMKALNPKLDVKIIGVPANGNPEQYAQTVKQWLK